MLKGHDGGPAFRNNCSEGMSVRTWLVGKIIQGVMSHPQAARDMLNEEMPVEHMRNLSRSAINLAQIAIYEMQQDG